MAHFYLADEVQQDPDLCFLFQKRLYVATATSEQEEEDTTVVGGSDTNSCCHCHFPTDHREVLQREHESFSVQSSTQTISQHCREGYMA